jgi:imidazolonepropionase-like amidohydrolase
MKRALLAGLCAGAVIAAQPAAAGSIVIRNATVHTLAKSGTLKNADLVITDGKITAIGQSLKAPADAQVIDAAGRPVTPGLFGGLSHLGLEEIGLEPAAEDFALKLGAMRPEFDVTLAFNPDSTEIEVGRLGGVAFTVIVPTAEPGAANAPGGTIIAGQGAVVTFDGAVGDSRALFIDVGGDVNALSGGSRAAQFMLLRQAFAEAHSPNMLLGMDQRLLTPAGRQTLLGYAARSGLVVVEVDRASDIRQVLAFAAREKLHIAISGGVEAWRVAPELAAAKVPVLLNPLSDLPETFDEVGATLENAARLNRAGVAVAFTFVDPDGHMLRKLRQGAGVAVAHGLPWEAGLAAITKVPAEIFGVANRLGTIETGRVANIVLWSGDPLDVTSAADEVIVGGKLEPHRSRQTELRDRYLERLRLNAAR